ncbi:hypothetical protein OB955_24015 [Halobacteria archaeon AArc-m2/3/4]|uniref:Uncharacterized protein n=1 Tax=Natronoglomus mannanivorans TaxID=2979990 RepID=A0AAP2YYX6_9EURY|nr:hypothetical protein [Halobacteria archaeon AArc-xg1-1]MCU4975752.1 hypothetical protein [Halobacteria archaeon AArc-m2/3/4]
MNRRQVLAAIGMVPTVGCLATDSDSLLGDDSRSDTPDETVDTAVEELVVDCETKYIRENVTGDNETVRSLQPRVEATDIRPDGDFVEVRSTFGTAISHSDEPDLHADYEIGASYLVAEDDVYRTEAEAGDPRNGTRIDC